MNTNTRPFQIISYLEARHHEENSELKFALVKEDCENDYLKEHLPVIPAGTVIRLDHGGDYGLYAMADIEGQLHQVKFYIHELHKIHFPDIDGELE